MTWRQGMRTPAIIDTMNKRCYDILPPKRKKELIVTYQPLVESSLTYSLLADPSTPLMPILPGYGSFIGGSDDVSKIYLPGENPIPLEELETLDSFRAMSPENYPPELVLHGIVVNGRQVYTDYQQLELNVTGSTKVSAQVDILVIDNGDVYTRSYIIVFDVGITYNGSIIISSNVVSPRIIVIGRYGYALLSISVVSPSGTIIPSTSIVEIDMQTYEVVDAKLYVGLPLYDIYFDQNGYPVAYSISGSGTQTNTMYRYRLSGTSIYPLDQLVFTMPTAPLPVTPQPYYSLLWFNPPYATITVPRTSISTQCRVLDNGLECYQGMETIEYGGVKRTQPILAPFIYLGDTSIYISPYISTTTSQYYLTSIVVGDKPYGYYYPVTLGDERIYPQAIMHSIGGDLYMYGSMNVYVHMAEPIPWTECCRIPDIGAECLYSPPYPFPPYVTIYVDKIYVPFTAGSISPSPAQTVLPSSITSTSPGAPSIVSKDVAVTHIC